MNLVWFRKDLRIVDNPALTTASKNGPYKAIFISTPLQWHNHDMAPIQVDFIERHLNLLKNQLSTLGVELVHIEASNFDNQISSLLSYVKANDIQNVYANSEVEFNEQLRDKTIIDLGVSLNLMESDVIVPKGKVLNGSGEMYKVFTPFRNSWLKYLVANGCSICDYPHLLQQNTKARTL